MKLPILTAENVKRGEKELPSQFQEAYRPDLIRRAVHALQSSSRQPYGSSPEAGLRHSSKLSKRRRKYRGSYGLGISRVNRKILSRRGTRFNWAGAFSPQTRGGRRAHPPKPWKIRVQKINFKENQKAIRSAIAATVNADVVRQRGHKIPLPYPFLIDSSFEAMAKTKDVEAFLQKLGFHEELVRGEYKNIRAGIGKLRGRPYQRKKSLLIVVSESCPLMTAAQNIPGVDIAIAKSLNAELLAPGGSPGRATLWTEKAIEALQKHKFFNTP